MIHFKKFIVSFIFAARGLRQVFNEEQNFRVQVAGTILVFIAAAVFGLKTWEIIALALVSIIVLVLELINSIMERFVDMASPRLHARAEGIKNIMAGAVLLASLGAFVVGLIIFIPHIAKVL